MKLRPISLVFTCLVALTTAKTAVDSRVAFRNDATLNKFKKHTLLSLRGGAGPLDPDMVAKANTIIQMAQAAPLALSPSKAMELYGFSPSPMGLYITQQLFISLLSYAVGLWSLIFEGKDVTFAVGAGAIPYLAIAVKSLLDDTPAKLGKSPVANYVSATLSAAAVYVAFTGPSYADTFVKFIAVWSIVNGLYLFLAPKNAASNWGVNLSKDVDTYLMKGYGAFVLGGGVNIYALTQGLDPKKSMGLSMITHFLFLTDSLFISKSADKFNTPKEPLYAWLVEHLVTIVTLAL